MNHKVNKFRIIMNLFEDLTIVANATPNPEIPIEKRNNIPNNIIIVQADKI